MSIQWMKEDEGRRGSEWKGGGGREVVGVAEKEDAADKRGNQSREENRAPKG